MAHKHRDLIIAWANGAKIEFKNKKYGIWVDIAVPTWAINGEYRIKVEPKLVPFSFEDHTCVLGKVIKGKNSSYYHLVTSVGLSKIMYGSNESITYQELLDYYTFADGSPCGKLEK